MIPTLTHNDVTISDGTFLTSVHVPRPPEFACYEKKGETEKLPISLILNFLYVSMNNNTYLADLLSIIHVFKEYV